MIVTWSQGNADENMPEEILVALCDAIARHPWWQARAKLTLSILERMGVQPSATILDAGCGWGVTLDALERKGYRPDGLDLSRRTLELLDRSDRTLIEADLSRPVTLPPGAKPYDAVLALDVIEHIDDDRAAVSHLAQLTRPGGVAIVSVPALPGLYSEFDAVQGHRRRYLPETLRDAFSECDLEIDQVLWWGSWLVPFLKRQRRRASQQAGEPVTETYRRYLKLPPWPIRAVLRLAFAIDQSRTLSGKPNIGTSLFAVARRKKAAPPVAGKTPDHTA